MQGFFMFCKDTFIITYVVIWFTMTLYRKRKITKLNHQLR
ncbi:TPA: DUF3021 family protein [Bacillus thuringiensis]|nr:DUF3021 family protein [Bacillus thuringiensis]